MLYQLFSFLDKHFSIPGLGVFQFLTSRIAIPVSSQEVSMAKIRMKILYHKGFYLTIFMLE